MTENQIRSDIKARIPRFLRSDDDMRLVEEMEICAGKARVDMAVISDRLIGIEIKGPQDSLRRLPRQVDQYSKCFDQVMLVVHELHAKGAIRIIPQWWGVVVGTDNNGGNSYHLERQASMNCHVDLDVVLSLLWRPELEELCNKFLQVTPSVRDSKRKLRSQLLKDIVPDELKAAGINMLRLRQGWRSVPIGEANQG